MMPDQHPIPTLAIAADAWRAAAGPELYQFLDRLFDLSGVDLSGWRQARLAASFTQRPDQRRGACQALAS